MKWKPWRVKLVNYWPPFFGAGIRVRRISPDFREIDVEMRQSWFNTNYVGVHFGGSLYAMTDPFYMLMVIENLGPDYIVWDKAASIRFKRPGRGKVRASFRISQQKIDEIRAAADSNDKHEVSFVVSVLNSEDETVAQVDKLIYIRKKSTPRQPESSAP